MCDAQPNTYSYRTILRTFPQQVTVRNWLCASSFTGVSRGRWRGRVRGRCWRHDAHAGNGGGGLGWFTVSLILLLSLARVQLQYTRNPVQGQASFQIPAPPSPIHDLPVLCADPFRRSLDSGCHTVPDRAQIRRHRYPERRSAGAGPSMWPRPSTPPPSAGCPHRTAGAAGCCCRPR